MAIQTANTLETVTSSTRKRVIYQSEALFCGETGTSYLQRVQSINYNFTVPRTDVNQYGQLGQIERVIVEVPTVSLDFDYLLAGVTNEKLLLGTNSGSGSKGVIYDLNTTSTIEKQRYKIGLCDEGKDHLDGVLNTGVNKGFIIDAGFLTSYAWNAAVGEVPTASVGVESTKMEVGTVGSTGTKFSATTPAVLRPGNVKFTSAATGGSIGAGSGDDVPALGFNIMHVQNASVSLDIPRESISRLGDKFEYARLITFPISATLSLEGIVSSQAASNLEDIVGTQDTAAPDPGFDIALRVGKASTGVNGIGLKMKNAKIDGHSISSSIGANKSVTLDYTVQVDGGSDTFGASAGGLFLEELS
jgi:hypothetical protein